MRMSMEWINNNVCPRYAKEESENKDKVEFDELDDNIKKKIERFFIKVVSCINFLKKQGFLLPDVYEEMLIDVFNYTQMYCSKDFADVASILDEIAADEYERTHYYCDED